MCHYLLSAAVHLDCIPSSSVHLTSFIILLSPVDDVHSVITRWAAFNEVPFVFDSSVMRGWTAKIGLEMWCRLYPLHLSATLRRGIVGCDVYSFFSQTASQIDAVEPDMADNDDRGITSLTVLSGSQEYHVSVVCADTGHSQNYQSIYAVMFRQKITHQFCPGLLLAW